MSRALARDERIPLDAYYTPDEVARSCLTVIRDVNSPSPSFVLEPSVGGGAFARAVRKIWLATTKVVGVDIDPDAAGFADCDQAVVKDFLELESPTTADWIVGNPPFGEAEAHVRKALWLEPRYGVAFLLRLGFLESEKRRAFWKEHPPTEVHVLVRRPSFTGGSTDSAAYGFFVWRTDHQAAWAPTLGWIG